MKVGSKQKHNNLWTQNHMGHLWRTGRANKSRTEVNDWFDFV